MRFAAQRTLHMQDNLPSNGTVYMPNLDNKVGSMMKALRDWEKRRGLSLIYKGKFISHKAKAAKKAEEKPKAKVSSNRPITEPRERMKPGRKPTISAEERKRRKLECNRLYRAKTREQQRERARQWRAKASPEQKAAQLQRVKDWRAAKLAATNAQAGV
jgi:hypothetical protein